MLEGLVPEVIANIIKSLVTDGHTTLQELNHRIVSFPYAVTDRNNKPQPFHEKMADFKVKLTAAKLWCLIRLLPLMIGDIVSDNNIAWGVLLGLKDIVVDILPGVLQGGYLVHKGRNRILSYRLSCIVSSRKHETQGSQHLTLWQHGDTIWTTSSFMDTEV